MLGTILRGLKAGVVTTRYPEERTDPPARFRGAPEIQAGGPFEALRSKVDCPSGAVTLTTGEEGSRYAIDLARCLFCGDCRDEPSDDAAEAAISIGREFELAARTRRELVVEVRADAAGRIEPAPVEPNADAAIAEQVAAKIRRTLGRSLHLRHLDAGSCNACDWELTALLNPRYDVRRLGIDFVASPRHADGVIVTGPVTRNLELAVRRTYEAVPEPRIVVATGACASSGGIAGKSYASCGGVGELLPVDVYIPGCPPRPEAIIFGILLALGRLDARRR